MAEALAAIEACAFLAKQLLGLIKEIKSKEARRLIEQLSDQAGTVMDAAALKIKCAGLMESNLALQQEIEQLNKRLIDRGKTRAFMKEKLIYVNDPAPDESSGPYCPVCYSREKKLELLTERPFGMRAFGRWHCSRCNEDPA